MAALLSPALSGPAPCLAPPPIWPRPQDYGGYLSTYLLPAKGDGQAPVFSCGSALSPITDFKLYGEGPDKAGTRPPRAASQGPV